MSEWQTRAQAAEAENDWLHDRARDAEKERNEALRSAALREMETARADEYRAQLNDMTGRLIAQRRRLRELEELQAEGSSWQRTRADGAEARLRELGQLAKNARDLADIPGFDRAAMRDVLRAILDAALAEEKS